MAFFFGNQCQYRNCGQKFNSLAALIQHVERCHVFLDDDEKISNDQCQMVPLSKVLPNDINDVRMGRPVSQPSGSRRNFNALSSLQAIVGNGNPNETPVHRSRAKHPSTSSVLNVNMNTPESFLQASDFNSSISSYNSFEMPSMSPMELFVSRSAGLSSPTGSNQDSDVESDIAFLFENASNSRIFNTESLLVPDQRDEPTTDRNSFALEFNTEMPTTSRGMYSQNPPGELISIAGQVNALREMQNELGATTMTRCNRNTHIEQSGLTVEEIIKLSVRLADHSEAKPYRCPIEGCNKKYKGLNGLKYHINAPRKQRTKPIKKREKSKQVSECPAEPPEHVPQPSAVRPSHDIENEYMEEDINVVDL
ncbi:juxtaposed with another zinc finger protein 1-like [Teleopsis dalmanni]|uniref:juxtaposed with another zinc finger protein 1-like n=1 Tax=Teleopsis dalmanni TaxID=139649 RepID=UPI000D329ED5|nr:juxtaposed with another zinc finger protein 1-like [Teleopsis dalmanni]